MATFQKYDPSARRVALLLLTAGTVVGLVLLWALDAARPALERWVVTNAGYLADNPIVPAAVAAVGLLPVAAFAAHLFRYGLDVIRNERFPLPGEEVVRSTLTRFGREAVGYGRVLCTLAVALLAACVGVVYFFWAIFSSLAS